MLRGVEMREINKVFMIIILLELIAISIISCKTVSLVNFESEEFEQFKIYKSNNINNSGDLYFTRIITAKCIDIVFRKISINKDFKDICIENIQIFDDGGNRIFSKKVIQLTSSGITHKLNDYEYQIYSYEIPNEEFDRFFLKNYKTAFIIISFEIEGKQYSEKLKRVEKKYIVTRT